MFNEDELMAATHEDVYKAFISVLDDFHDGIGLKPSETIGLILSSDRGYELITDFLKNEPPLSCASPILMQKILQSIKAKHLELVKNINMN